MVNWVINYIFEYIDKGDHEAVDKLTRWNPRVLRDKLNGQKVLNYANKHGTQEIVKLLEDRFKVQKQTIESDSDNDSQSDTDFDLPPTPDFDLRPTQDFESNTNETADLKNLTKELQEKCETLQKSIDSFTKSEVNIHRNNRIR